jgi:hypothetical protein
MAALANAIPIFLVLTNKIDLNHFIFIFLSEVLFWLGFVKFNKPKLQFKKTFILENENKDLILFIVYLFILIALRLSIYVFVGVPLFMEDGRLSTFINSGGLGLLERLSSLPTFFCAFYSFKLIEKEGKYKFLGFFTLLLVIIFSILSGAKASILIIIGVYFYYNLFYKDNVIHIRKILRFLPILLAVPIFILAIDGVEREFGPVMSLLIRFVANGDVYFMSFPYNTIDIVQISNKFTYFFGGILLPLRIIDHGSVDTTIGFQLNWFLHSIIDGGMTGPNTRLPVLSWIFFKWGGLLFAFFSGLILSFFYNKCSKLFSNNIINFMVIGYLQYNLLTFITDPVLCIGYILDILINLFVFYVIYYLINIKFVVYQKNDT